MSRFISEHASGSDWKVISDKLAEKVQYNSKGANPECSYLGIVYFTDQLTNEADSIIKFLRDHTGVQEWIGSVGIGICGSGTVYFDTPAVAFIILQLPKDGFYIIDGEHSPLLKSNNFNNKAIKGKSNFGILHIDPRNRNIDKVLQLLTDELDCFSVGGLSSSRNHLLQIAGEIKSGEITGAVISDSVNVITALTQSCVPISTEMSITDYHSNTIIELDGNPALQVLKDVIKNQGETNSKFQPEQVLVALSVLNSDIGDYLVRNLTAIEVKTNSVSINEAIEPNSTLKFCRRDSEAAELDLIETVKKLKKRLSTTPKGGVYFSCLARGPNMFDGVSRELELIENELGDLPIVGLFCNGEISNQRLYSYTGVLSLFT